MERRQQGRQSGDVGDKDGLNLTKGMHGLGLPVGSDIELLNFPEVKRDLTTVCLGFVNFHSARQYTNT